MANHLATGLMLQREVQLMLPKDAVTFSEDTVDGVLVKFSTCGRDAWVHFDRADLPLSLDAIRAIYKPKVDEALFTIWGEG